MDSTAYKHCREEERYEVNLAGGRLNSLLSSQSFLFIVWAGLYKVASVPETNLILVAVPLVALSICIASLASIFAAIVVSIAGKCTAQD